MSSSSSNSSPNLTPERPYLPEGAPLNNNPISPQPVEDNTDVVMRDIPEENYEADDEEEEEEEDEEESAPMPPPNPNRQGLRLRIRLNQPTTGQLALPITAVPPTPASSSSSVPRYDPYQPYPPRGTYPWLEREVGSQDRRIRNLEDIIELYPSIFEMEDMQADIQQLIHATQRLTTRLPIVDKHKFHDQRIAKLEENMDKMQAHMSAMNEMMAELYRNRK